MNYSVKNYEFFKFKSISLEEYKFELVDIDGKVSKFKDIYETFFIELMHSLRNLMTAGDNFNIEKFKFHEIFYEWFEHYTKKDEKVSLKTHLNYLFVSTSLKGITESSSERTLPRSGSVSSELMRSKTDFTVIILVK